MNVYVIDIIIFNHLKRKGNLNMSKIFQKLKKPSFYIIIVLICLRIFLGWASGIQFNSIDTYDDALFIAYTDLQTHFLSPNYLSLVKTMSFPLFLNFVKATGLQFSIITSLLLIIDAFYFKRLIKMISKNKWIEYFSFVYVLFFPTAFELWQGTRVYRNTIIAPFVMFMFIYMIEFTYKNLNRHISVLDCLISIIMSIVFTFTYYIKEDGLWLLACLLFFILVNIVISIFNVKKVKQKIKYILTIFLCFSLMISGFSCITSYYKYTNAKYFGVPEIETRNGGELGEFAANIYKIDSNKRNMIYWAPKEAIDKAWKTSKTLQEHPELYQAIINTPWYGNIGQNPIQGDFLTWVLRTALYDTGLWTNEKNVSDLFHQVNEELEKGFEDGTLKKDTRIQLLSSAGGRTFREIISLAPLVYKSFLGSIFLEGYIPGINSIGNSEDSEVTKSAADYTNTSYIEDYSKKFHSNFLDKVIQILFWIYRIMNCVLFISILITIGFYLFRLFRYGFKAVHKNASFLFLTSLICLGIGVVYAIAISWFSQFIFISGVNMSILNFYVIGLPVLLSFSYFTSLVYLVEYS